MEIIFWESDSTNCPVTNFIDDLHEEIQTKLIDTLKRFEIRGTEFVHDGNFLSKMKGCCLWEIKVRFQKVFYRILLVIIGGIAYLMHAFKKKSNQTPLKEIRTALGRVNILENQLKLILI